MKLSPRLLCPSVLLSALAGLSATATAQEAVSAVAAATAAPTVPGADSTAAAAAPPAKAAKSPPNRTSNRGPEQAALKFHLPPPPVLSPEETRKTFRLQPGFRIECIASEPMIEAPVAMSWDPQGRLYVVEMRGYMHDVEAAGEDQPIGRVSRLEDLNGDGIMDKATVFADKLLMPRSVTAYGDGAIIARPPDLIWFRDQDGDGVAEKREVIADNFGTRGGQPEHMANSLTYCQDNWLWGAGYGSRLRRKDGRWISEPVRSGGQWGLTQDDDGRRFYNFNSDFLRADLLPPGVYARNPHVTERPALGWQVLKDQQCWNPAPTPGVNRGYEEGKPKPDGSRGDGGTLRADGTLNTCTATCGPVIYRGGLFGPEFQGNAFIPEPAGQLVKRVVLTEQDGLLTARNAYDREEFLTSPDERFRPVNAYNGPDGGLYIVDMGRGVIQHRFFLTHYLIANIRARHLEQPLNLGRIWRIVPDHSKPSAVRLPSAPAELAAFLDHPNGHLRDTAQQALVEQGGEAVTAAVQALAVKGKSPLGRAQALRTLEGLGPAALSPEVLTTGLRDPDPKVRAATVRLAGLPQAGELLAMTAEPSPVVRIELALQLSALNLPGAPEAVLKLLEAAAPGALLHDAIACGSRGRELELLELLLASPATTAAPDPRPLAVAHSALAQTLAGCVMTERRASRVTRLLDLAAAQPADGPARLALVRGMAGISPYAKGRPPIRKLLYLDSAPASIAALESTASGALKAEITPAYGGKKPLLDFALSSLAWPGKPGVPAPPVIVPLTAEQQARFDHGKVLYAALCGTCHQPNGTGMDGLAPPLLDSEWVLGPVDRPVRIILHGVSGPLPVSGRTWDLSMPPLPLSDDDIAGVLTYLRREWEHTASPVTPAEVTKIRAAHASRTQPWTADELKAPRKK